MLNYLARIKVQLLFLFVSLIFISPQLYISHPGLTDDGSDFLIAQSKSLNSIFVDELFFQSRTWPLRLVIKKIMVAGLGLNIELHYLFYGVLLSVLLFLFYRLLKNQGVREMVAIIASLLLLTLPSVVGNFFRLGTAEHFQLILLLLGLIFLEKKPLLASGFFLINLLVKETSIFYIFIPIFYFLTVKKNVKTLALMILGGLSFICLVVVKSLYFKDQYLDRFQLSFDNLFMGLKETPATFVLLLGLLMIISLFHFQKITLTKNLKRNLVYLICLLLPLLFWNMDSYYYHLPLQTVMVLILAQLLELLLKKINVKSWSMMFFGLVIAIVIVFSLPATIYTGRISHLVALEDSTLVKFILDHNWQNYHVYSSLWGYERNLKLSSYFLAWSKTQSEFFYPANDNLLAAEFNESALTTLAKSAPAKYWSDLATRKILISSRSDREDIPWNYRSGLLCGSSILVKHHCIYFYETEGQLKKADE